ARASGDPAGAVEATVGGGGAQAVVLVYDAAGGGGVRAQHDVDEQRRQRGGQLRRVFHGVEGPRAARRGVRVEAPAAAGTGFHDRGMAGAGVGEKRNEIVGRVVRGVLVAGDERFGGWAEGGGDGR